VAICHSVAVLHQNGLAHGDLHANNFLVKPNLGYHSVHLIDFDNFQKSNAPSPLFQGQVLYLAPEIRAKRSFPSIAADCYSLTVLLHELLLRTHPIDAAANDNPDKWLQLAIEGEWPLDPARQNDFKSVAPIPPEILATDVARLFRRGMSADPSKRPTAQEWC